MGLIAPPTYIAPPALEPHRFGLYSIANMGADTGRWDLGVEFEPLTGERAALRVADCVDDYTPQVDLREGEGRVEGVPFVVVGSYSCTAQSRPIAEARERAALHLAAGEERAVEHAISTGAVSVAPSFTQATDLTPAAGPISVIRGVGLLEEALYDLSPSVGAIHAPRVSAPTLSDRYIASRFGQHMETPLGTKVAFGAYRNLGPNGETADNGFWLYATGTPTVRRGDVFTQPDEDSFLDRSNNYVAIMSQRDVLVTWGGPTLAVLVENDG